MQVGSLLRFNAPHVFSLFLTFALAIWPRAAAMADPAPATGESAERFASFGGIAVTYDSGFAYAGGIWALGRPVEAPGFRLRALAGGGSYGYDSSLPGPGAAFAARFNGDVSLVELMAGYLLQRGPWTFKGYAGAVYLDHAITPFDPGNGVQGVEWGAKALVEIWRNLGERSFLSLDASIASTFGDYRVHSRLGRRMTSNLSLGGELGAVGNEDYDALRAGAFVRWHREKGEFTLTGGGTGDYLDEDMTPYLTFDYYRRF